MAKESVSPYAGLMAIRGVTQKDMADCLGYSPQAVSAWFTGKVIPKLTLDQWYALADLMGTTIDKLPRSFAPQPIHNTSSDV
jgi:transcriptional regulator with XRE-family HTH domain